MISSIAIDIFGTAKCQRDLNARLGDFIAALHAAGIQTPRIGQVAWRDRSYVDINLGPDLNNVVITGWHFAFQQEKP